jgi:peptidase S41-like protein
MAHLRVWIYVLAVVLASGAPATAQMASGTPPAAPAQPLLRAADLMKDFAILREAYEQLHPGLYRYSSKTEMDEKFAALQKSLNHDQSLQDAYLAFSLFAAQVKCGHTYANFFNQPKPVVAALFKGQTRVPFYFRWLDNTMVVTQDFTPEHKLPRGTRLLSINGIPSHVILERLLTIARADGSNEQKRVAYLEVTGDETYEAFDIYFPMFFPEAGTTLQLQVKLPGASAVQNISAEALTYEQRIAPIKARESNLKGGDEPVFEWKYLADGTAYLRMPTWALYDSKWDWKSWLDAHLDELAERKPGALIVDLRGNEGGNDIGNEILTRLVRSDLKIAGYRRLVRCQKVPADLEPYLDTWDPSFKDWGAAAAELENPWPTAPPVHYLALTKYDDDKSGADVIHPSGKPFTGKVFVLVDANNSSATFQFASAVQRNKLGLLVGQPTGGNQRGINGGAFFFLRLPNSQIEMDLPLIGSFPATPQPDGGLTPDVVVNPALQDIIDGKDAEMSTVEELETAKP